jgi:acetylornithine deacetylase/succinyl-diaminopimelate desuccinylase-like protein
VRVLVEGEEEIGSPTLHAFLTAHLEELRSDVLVLADAGNWQVGVPGLTYSLRGLAAADIELRALDGPQHSGISGGAIPDPVMALSRLLASLVDENGDLAFDGAFDGLLEATPNERVPIAGFDDAPQSFARAAGVRPGVRLVGDPHVTLHERLWLRPCLTVIGIDGHPIKGSSNQIVARASARLSLRLGPGQEPERVLAHLRTHLERHVPWGLECTITALEGAPAWQTDPTGPAFDAARRALHAGFGVEAVPMGIGGSIPFVGPFADAFGGIPALLIGPNDPGSNIHGEDESLHLADWRSLIRSEVFLLRELAR